MENLDLFSNGIFAIFKGYICISKSHIGFNRSVRQSIFLYGDSSRERCLCRHESMINLQAKKAQCTRVILVA
jgi:hypothetical protein